ncbi:unnamed protein product [Acanthoscelides obtectus]|uniref:MARVEL domain-containing protein n=1 Tax=Acanthoscelides obtectus TaxID=200917 RepID=A0A9P0PN79_ACAOB|nr:unnamed protein product [Acanthoscelides obtectus]CAK1662237.1 hypothetical protein AOBTE_LOCUS23049 [Acanthoscelides obtectus]
MNAREKDDSLAFLTSKDCMCQVDKRIVRSICRMVAHGIEYLCTHIGQCKVVEIAFCISVLALEGGVWHETVLDGLFAVAIAGLIVSLALLILSIFLGYTLDSYLVCQAIPLLLLGILSVVFGIYTAVEYEERKDTLLIAGIFGFVTGCVYIIDAFLAFKNYY